MQDADEAIRKRGTERSPGRAFRVATLILLAALCTCVIPRPASAAEGEKVQLSIEAGTAAVRLNEWARKTQYSVLSSFEQTSQLRTKAIDGLYEPIEALRLMLEGTGLEFSFANARFVSIYMPEGAQAPVRGPPPGPVQRRPTRSAQAPATGPADIEEVRITGTHIHDSVQVGLPETRLTRVDFDEIGAFSVIDAIRTIPQIWGGGPTEDTELGPEAGSNSGRGHGINLRGLDAGSSLVLINGRRLAPGGSEGLFIDVSSIPLIALEQIDVISDGASALYGADAVGGVVNFVMRENIDGAESQLRVGGFGQAPGSLQFGQVFGGRWDGGRGLMAFEYFERDPLAARERKQVTSDLRSFGGSDFRSTNSNPGTILFGELTFAIPEGQDGTGLTIADLVPNTQNRYDTWTQADILPEQERWSAYGNLRHALTDDFELFADALLSDRRALARTGAANQVLPVPCSNAFMIAGLCSLVPGLEFIPVAYSFSDDLGPLIGDVDVLTANVAAGFTRTIGMDWGVTTTASYALEQQDLLLQNTVDFNALLPALANPDPAGAFNPFGDGSHTNREILEGIRSQQELRTHSTVTSLNVTASGPVFAMPGGQAKLAIGTDLRNQAFESNVRAGDGPINRVHNDRDVHALFGELYVPLVGAPNARRGLRKLELSLAARLENYSHFGEATSPRVGLAWSPLPGFSLRGSWAKSLRAPSLYDLNEVNNVVTQLLIPTPATPPGAAPVLVQSGRNAQLQEERARSWTFGVDFTPEGFPGLSFAVTYFDVEFRDRISELDFLDYDWLNDPLVANRVTFDPTPEQMRSACASGQFNSAISSFTGPCEAVPVAAIIDVRKHNAWFLRTRGLDLSTRYTVGDFKFGLLGTYVLDYSEALLEGTPLIEMQGTQNYPVELRMRGSATWQRGRLAATTAVNFTDSYRDTLSERQVNSWTTFDFGLAYTLGREDSRTRLALNVENAFDEMPPFLNNAIGLGYDAENGEIAGRIISFQLRRDW